MEFHRVAALLSLCVWLALPAAAGGDPGKPGSGNPHQDGRSGNPHQDGASGNPHQGAPHGQAAPQAEGRGKATAPGQVKRRSTRGKAESKPKGKPQARRRGGADATPKRRGARGEAKRRGASRGKAERKGQAKSRGNKGGREDRPAGKTTICHATGSETNPFVVITISDNALEAHARHQNEEDVIPAPEGVSKKNTAGCRPTTTTTPPGGPGGPEGPGGPGGPQVQSPGMQPTAQAGPPDAPVPGGQVMGVADEDGDDALPVSGGDVAEVDRVAAAEDEREEAAAAQLPFTGLQLAALLLIGLASLAAGISLRRGA